jgi:hypothetical protein
VRRAFEDQRWSENALNAGLCALSCLYFSCAACLALALYDLLQPVRHPNPGIPAVELSSGAVPFVLAMKPEARSPGDSIQQSDGSTSKLCSHGTDALDDLAIELCVEKRGDAEKRPNKPVRLDRASNTADLKRTRRAQLRALDTTTDYAAQAAFASYGAWGGNKSRGNHSGWDNYPVWDSYRVGGSYQPRGGRQSGFQSRH